MRPHAFLRFALPLAAALSFPAMSFAAHAAPQGGQGTVTPTPNQPRLDYQVETRSDEQPSYDSERTGYRGSGSSQQGYGVPEQGPAAPDTASAPALPPSGPDPAYVGSGTVVNGWYYPPPMVTTTVTEYEPVTKKR